MEWIDKEIEKQREQKELLDKISFPYSSSELCELITEQDELEGNHA